MSRSLGKHSSEATLDYRIGRIFRQAYLRKLQQRPQIIALGFLLNCHGYLFS